ncbi:hypothetical protein [Vitiosangium sp. GDMCC 1.1324]|uniref:hypothetical protein n=1 Tax=Vitiosangium sp. (strain GDMCC 1.1324) TaxID=2138576 RepID=UPI0011B7189A|nr:hypothetical protein [Vitiosangium sp. GDMCC 1.1324]
MCPSGGVSEEADDLTSIVNGSKLGGGRAREIKLAEYTVLENQTVLDARCISKGSDNITALVQSCGLGTGSAREIELGKSAAAERKSVVCCNRNESWLIALRWSTQGC